MTQFRLHRRFPFIRRERGVPSASIVPSEAHAYYTQQIYWNDFDQVRNYMNSAISGRPDIDWSRHVLAAFGKFESAFVINCGNGWVERDLHKIGLIREVVGIDIGQQMIDEAIREAEAIGFPARYSVADCNTFEPGGLKVDLVINHAAMHHVAYVNRLTRAISNMLKPGGKYIAFDYVGPHRNQYPKEMWSAVLAFNASLPERLRLANIPYPHMKTMLHVDPTEAIHSELQLDVMRRYFDIEQFVPLGGPIAYHILFGNNALHAASDTDEGAAILQRVVEADRTFTVQNPHTNLFAFWVATPKTSGAISEAQASRWQAEENEREAAGLAAGGRYYPPTPLEMANP